jgi:hypothetical protein
VGSVARNTVREVLRTSKMLKWAAVIWNLTGNKPSSSVLAVFSTIPDVQVTSLRCWVAVAAEGGSSKAPIVSAGRIGSVAMVEIDGTVNAKEAACRVSTAEKEARKTSCV